MNNLMSFIELSGGFVSRLLLAILQLSYGFGIKHCIVSSHSANSCQTQSFFLVYWPGFPTSSSGSPPKRSSETPSTRCSCSSMSSFTLYFHHKGFRPYVLVCAFIFVTDRIVLRLIIRSTRATATVTILPDKKTVRVTLRPNPRSPLKWYAGDHVFLSIPSVAYLHPHPFSIASTPGNSLEFLIRARDGFSKKLLEAATNGPSEFTAIVDGPYGSCFAYECLQDSDVALLVSGGSDIAVIYPLVHELATTTASTRNEEHGTSLLRGNDAPKRIVMVWVVREKCQLSWLHGGELEDLRKLGVVIVTHVTPKDVVVGKRPKMKDVVEGVGCDLKSSDSRSDGGRERGSIGVVVCGPSGMVRDTRNSCAGMMRRGLDVRIVTEKFGCRANSIE